MKEVSDVVHPGPGMAMRVFAWGALVIIVGTMVGIIASFVFGPDGATGEPGELDEEAVEEPADLTVPSMVDTTEQWGLAEWRTQGLDPLRGGATLHDLDGDDDLDLLIAGGVLGVYEWTGDTFTSRPAIGVGDVVAVFAGDVDGDETVDLVVGTADGATVVWGGSWFDDTSETLDLGATGLVTGAIPVDLGEGANQVLLLGYGSTQESTPDFLLTFDGRRIAGRVELPNSVRKSMVAEIADIDEDGLADIWVARDVGWASGGDSIYSRRGGVGSAWVDIGPEVGAAIEIDAMGLTVADLTGDGRLDAYVSDLGDNELLERTAGGFEKLTEVGAARIRSGDAEDNEISSSWASGAADLNLDGRLDLVVANGGFAEISVVNKVVNTFILEDDPPALLLGLADGRFFDAWPSLSLNWQGRSRGMALGDIDRDGDTDIVIVDHGGGAHALRNDVLAEGAGHTMSAGCLAGGSVARSGDAGAPFLVHQQSFLGAHAPEFRLPVRAVQNLSPPLCPQEASTGSDDPSDPVD